MRLTHQKLQDLWRSGYCADTVRHAATTEMGEVGSEERIKFLKQHIQKCECCRNANMMKALEENVARLCGGKALVMFYLGVGPEQVVDRATFEAATEAVIRPVLDEATDEFLTWMSQVAMRGEWANE